MSGAHAAETVLAVNDLVVRFETASGPVQVVDGISFTVARGETLAIVGESGSGKSQAVMALMGLQARNGRVGGQARFLGQDLIGLEGRALDAVRGRQIGMIFQEPMTSLDPLYRIGHQIGLPLRRHLGLDKAAARQRAMEWLAMVGIAEPERRIDAYPHELSGGQRQRVMIAAALAPEPQLLIADEPTTALDVTVQRRILDLLADLKARLNLAVILISHDLTVVRRYAERTAVMHQGKIVETAGTESLFQTQQSPITTKLVDAAPRGRKAPTPDDAAVILDAKSITVTYPRRGTFFKRADPPRAAVDTVDLNLREGETLGIVGESGSGKSSLGRALLKLVPASGEIRFEDRALQPLSVDAMRPLRARLQVVFQDPFGALSPRLTVGEIVTEGLKVHALHLSRAERDARAVESLRQVQLDPAYRWRFPHELSGGQRQRIAIARAMILKPRVVVLDEPTSALDRTVQGEIITLLRDLQSAHRLSYIFISHDLAVVRAMADRIAVMKDGVIVETGTVDAIIGTPRHAYTQALMHAAFG